MCVLVAKTIWYFVTVVFLLFGTGHTAPPPSPSGPLHFYNNALFAELTGNVTTTDDVIALASSNNGMIYCDGARYRGNLRTPSCVDAFSTIPRLQHFQTFGARIGAGAYDVALPQRFISGDGLCIIEIVLKDGATKGQAKYADILKSGRDLLFNCAQRGVGGIATDIGTDGALGLIMTSYVPRVECDAEVPVPPIGNCKNNLIDRMMTSSVQKYFGNKRDRYGRPDIILPKFLREIGGKCMAVLQSLGDTDLSSWYQIWEGAQAVYGMCLRFGRTGRARRGNDKVPTDEFHGPI
ncbi:MAG: hypothetical protein Q9181_000872 [Wetmoreana brouardii]